LLFSKVLVALDGSLTAEAVLGFLSTVVDSGPPDEVVLLTVVESADDASFQSAQAYLERTVKDLDGWWKRTGVPVPLLHTQAVGVDLAEPGKPPSKRHVAQVVTDIADGAGVDLIALTSNGWSGSDRWLLGPVAERVLQMAETSVLLIRADDYHQEVPVDIQHILVPLDGSELAEEALSYAGAIAARVKAAEARLIHVRPPREGAASGVMRPTYDFRSFPRGEEGRYLAEVAKRLETKRTHAATAVRDGDPGPQISAEARESGAHLIVMASHGRGGAQARPYGKVADDVLHEAPVPVLMIHTGLA